MAATRGAVITLALVAVLSCGGDDEFALTLRTRDPDGALQWGDKCSDPFSDYAKRSGAPLQCVSSVNEQRWVAEDGRRALSPAHTATIFFRAGTFGTVMCNEESAIKYWFATSPEQPSEESFDLEFDDGDAVTLHSQAGLWTLEVIGPPVCSEVTGTWVGTAGEPKGRTGTYRMVYDSIQTVLHLVED
jgi:hypothetical protein